MLMPKRVKYRKQMRGRRTGKETRGTTSILGIMGFRRWSQRGSRSASLKLHAAQSSVISNVGDACGFGSSRISR